MIRMILSIVPVVGFFLTGCATMPESYLLRWRPREERKSEGELY
jgi:hypothetical protein